MLQMLLLEGILIIGIPPPVVSQILNCGRQSALGGVTNSSIRKNREVGIKNHIYVSSSPKAGRDRIDNKIILLQNGAKT